MPTQNPVDPELAKELEAEFNANTNKSSQSTKESVLSFDKKTGRSEQIAKAAEPVLEFFKRSEGVRARALEEIIPGMHDAEGLKQKGEQFQKLVTGEEQLQFGDTLKKLGASDFVAATGGLGLDIATDPLTYLLVGGTKKAATALKSAIDNTPEQAIKNAQHLDETIKFTRTLDDFDQAIATRQTQLGGITKALASPKLISTKQPVLTAKYKQLVEEVTSIKAEKVLAEGGVDFVNSRIKNPDTLTYSVESYLNNLGANGKILGRQARRYVERSQQLFDEGHVVLDDISKTAKQSGIKLTEDYLDELGLIIEGFKPATSAFEQFVTKRFKDIADSFYIKASKAGLLVPEKGARIQQVQKYMPHRILMKDEVLDAPKLLHRAVQRGVKTGQFQTAEEGYALWDSYQSLIAKHVDEALNTGYKLPVDKDTTPFLQYLVSRGEAKNLDHAAQLFRKHYSIYKKGFAGNIEAKRLVNIPFIHTNPTKAFADYFDSASRRLSEVEHFGKNGEIANELVKRLGKDGVKVEPVVDMINILTGKTQPNHAGGWVTKTSASLRNLAIWTKMTMAFVGNAFQGVVNTTPVAGFKNSVRGLLQTAFGNNDIAHKAGVLLRDTNEAMFDLGGQGLARKAADLALKKLTPFSAIETMNRRWAAHAGVYWVDDLIKRYQNLKGLGKEAQQIERLLLKADIRVGHYLKPGTTLTEKDALSVAYNLTRNTQFSYDALSSPIWTNSDWGKLTFQFKSFITNQYKFIRDEIMKEAFTHNNWAPLVRWAALAPLAGEGMINSRLLLQGKDPRLERPGIIRRIIEDFAAAGSYGLLWDVIQSAKYGGRSGAASVILPPALATGSEMVANIVHGFEDREMAEWFNLRPLTSQLIREAIPFYGLGKRFTENVITPEKQRKQKVTTRLRQAMENNENLLPMLESIKQQGFSPAEIKASAIKGLRRRQKSLLDLKRAEQKGDVGKILKLRLGFDED